MIELSGIFSKNYCLLYMGFDDRWVNLGMSCVSSVSYSFVLNGRVCGVVAPSRGLKQGNPLYTLPIYSSFSHIRDMLRRRKFHGAKVSRKGPKISHLLFAVDNILFARANRQECNTIVDILNQYEQASGQKKLTMKSRRCLSAKVLILTSKKS